MKKKIFLAPIPIITLVGTTLAPLSSCSAKKLYYQEATWLRDVALNEFLEFIKVPHPTFGTRKICNYFKQWLQNLGYQEVGVHEELPDGKYFREDSYRAIDVENSSGNLIFNILPSPGCEQWKGITLQGHMDMVLDGFTPGKELEQSVKPVVHGDAVYTENHETSLGADCGAGLSLILALAKQPDVVSHGPIRCIFTADEEDGISGASNISAEDIKYTTLINLDGEDDKDIFISAAGTILTNGFADFDSTTEILPITNDEHLYEIEIKDLTGGHSANEINKNIPNAIMLAANIMSYFQNDPSFRIASFVTNEGATNAIAKHVTFRIVTSMSPEAMDVLILQRWDDFLKKFPSQKDLKVLHHQVSTTTKDVALNHEISENINAFLSFCLYGPISWLDLERKEVETSSNVGPLTLDLSDTKTVPHHLQCDFLSRSCYRSSLGLMYSYYSRLWSEYISRGECSFSALSPPWEANPVNKLRDLMIKANKAIDFETTFSNVHGWLECGYFYQRYATLGEPLQMLSIGSKLDHVHTKQETWHLDTFVTVIRQVLYCLEHINEI